MTRRISKEEAIVHKILIDIPDNCIWAIIDLLEHDKLLTKKVNETFSNDLMSLLSKILDYVNNQLENNEHVLPQRLIRQRKYPLIRQMRDVHQFDVGTHLAYCYSLALRKAPIKFCIHNSFINLATNFQNIFKIEERYKLSIYASILHDFFKCFRSRRPLPSKIGEKSKFNFKFPNGEATLFTIEHENEDTMAKHILPFFIKDDSFLEQLNDMIEISGVIGKIFYKALKKDADTIRQISIDYIQKQNLKDINFLSGLYLAIMDWNGKGYARYIVTVRKKGINSLDTVGKIFLEEIEKRI